MSIKSFFVAGAIALMVIPAHAQVRDTTAALEAIRRGLESGQISPDEVRARMQAAGLTPDDVRQRLREAGYPANMLDAYLSGSVRAGGAGGLSSSQLEDVLGRLSIPPLDPLALQDSLFAPETLLVDGLLFDTTLVAELPGLPVFGRNLFERATTQFFPVTMGPVPENYQLGPGDRYLRF